MRECQLCVVEQVGGGCARTSHRVCGRGIAMATKNTAPMKHTCSAPLGTCYNHSVQAPSTASSSLTASNPILLEASADYTSTQINRPVISLSSAITALTILPDWHGSNQCSSHPIGRTPLKHCVELHPLLPTTAELDQPNMSAVGSVVIGKG